MNRVSKRYARRPANEKLAQCNSSFEMSIQQTAGLLIWWISCIHTFKLILNNNNRICFAIKQTQWAFFYHRTYLIPVNALPSVGKYSHDNHAWKNTKQRIIWLQCLLTVSWILQSVDELYLKPCDVTIVTSLCTFGTDIHLFSSMHLGWDVHQCMRIEMSGWLRTKFCTWLS